MAVIEPPRAAPFGAETIYHGVTMAETLATRLHAWYEARSTRKELVKLSDRQLDDIGLSRSDIARL